MVIKLSIVHILTSRTVQRQQKETKSKGKTEGENKITLIFEKMLDLQIDHFK